LELLELYSGNGSVGEEDSNKAIELNPNYVKSYIRKARAERELLMNDKALETIKKGLEVEE
jgi:hypothetical protein